MPGCNHELEIPQTKKGEGGHWDRTASWLGAACQSVPGNLNHSPRNTKMGIWVGKTLPEENLSGS